MSLQGLRDLDVFKYTGISVPTLKRWHSQHCKTGSLYPPPPIDRETYSAYDFAISRVDPSPFRERKWVDGGCGSVRQEQDTRRSTRMIIKDDPELAVVGGPEDAVSLLAILGAEDIGVFIKEILRPTAKSFNVLGVAGQAHVSAGDLEDEVDPRLEDADEDEEDDGVNGSNGREVDTGLELADGGGGFWPQKDKEVMRRSFQAYECSHCIDLDVLVHEHVPVVVLLTCPRPRPPPTLSRPSELPSCRGAAQPDTGPVRAASPPPGSHQMGRTSCSAPPSGARCTEDAGASAAAAAADVDLLLGPADEPGIFLPPDRTPSTTGGRNTGGRRGVCLSGAAGRAGCAAIAHGRPAAAACRALLRHAGGGPEGVRRVAGEGGREPGGDEAGAAVRSPLEGTQNNFSDVVVVIAFLVMLFVIRFT
ncbi:hypothetical protein EDB87DRAFT_1688100 [Lactarius vividus]|nr:hypothetical protein EDB87DRAFT_1688100 [Lactarius vividus]